MTCPACGASTRDGARFCGTCGAALTHACPACGAPQAPDIRFCDACGSPLHARSRPIGRTALEGERKLVTVLFADLRDSTDLLADRDPEEAREIIDPVLQLMIDAVHAYDGMVNQVMGDGVMALFGAPVAHEDHAARACYAALRIQAAAARHSAALVAGGRAGVLIRIGINSGEVLVRSIGSDVDMDYTAVGETTNVASRLEQLAAPGNILCAATTLHLAEGLFDVRPRGPLTLRGVRHPVEAVEVLGARPGRSRFDVAVARGLTPFVGRADELRVLGGAVDEALEGRAAVVGLVGEPGIGKSRLVWEFTQSRAAAGWLVLKRAAASHGTDTPYLPVIDLLRGHFGIEPSARSTAINERVTARLLALDPALDTTLPALLALLDSEPTDPGWLALEPVRRRQETNDAIKQLFLRLAKTQPVLVVLEDLHWADHESRALLDWVMAGTADARLAILVTYRPEYRSSWSSRTRHTQIRLEPLPPPSAEALLDALVGRDRSLGSLKSEVLERTAGNPFFLEETVRTLVESGVLAGEPGALRLRRAPDAALVPASIQALLAARIDRLSDDDKRLLQEAAAIGAVVADNLLRAVSARSSEAFRTSVARLRDAEFLREAGLYPEILHVFSHALTREVAYATMVAERRRTLHVRIHAALEHLDDEQRGDHVEQLAHHALRGELWADAVRRSREAAGRAAARSAYREAAAHLEHALVALGKLPATPERSAEAIDIRFELRNALFPLGEIARDLENLRAAEQMAHHLGDERRLAWVSTYMTRDLSILGYADAASESGRRAWALASKVGDLEVEILAQGYLGAGCFARGGYREAVAMLGAAVKRLQGPLALQRFGLPGPASVFFRVWLVSSLVRLGDFAESRNLAQSGLEIAAAAEQPLARVVALYVSGYAAVHEGDLDRGIRELETSLAQCREWNVPGWFSNIASVLGYAYALCGKLADGEPLMRQAIEQNAATGSMMNHSSGVAQLAQGLLLAGRIDEAREHAELALNLARKYRESGNEASALFLLGEVARERGDLETGAAHQREARRLAEELGMQPLMAQCGARLGTLDRTAP